MRVEECRRDAAGGMHEREQCGGKAVAIGIVRAPEFQEGLDWLNTGGEALRLDRLRGKVVLLDFWTYG